MNLSDPPRRPARPSRASGWPSPATPWGLPCSYAFLVYMLSPLPRRSGWAHSFAHSSQPYQPSPKGLSGRPAHRHFRGLLGVHSRYGLHTRAVTVYRYTLTRGFSHFVTSMTAPVASGWSSCRVGLAPTGKRRLSTAHTQSYDTNVTAPTSSTVATLFPSEQYGSCPLQLKGLSYDWTSMNTLVNQMTPNGNTNQAIGLAWGWLSLVGGGPLTAPAMDSNYQYNQVIILLTDGLNTQDRWYSDQASIDARQQITCNNIKAAGITLYTVQVNTGGDPTSQLLNDCASAPSKFFILTSASQIVPTFNQIGTALSQLRISK